ncbi:hypothetical protein EHN06_11945 [Marinobacter sp. NP-4(2019)]|uniref:hypothetical protein n=1 Tax=Marinobacter sp. NP-4(2019) TaxID=2488665 RepID=UPI000FC3D35F|nr:hypothetical protein [Marinobacter sp. NP-4(2019)]AZT84192.1 hypothetical protein EHN06_11945 [Marinobacter sp. NP-4(2019)]
MKKPVTRLFGAVVTVVALGLSPMTSVIADEVKIPVGSQAERSEADLPRTGMSQASVRESWGTPRETRGPVGDPPISQWHYDGFVVYFEGSHVIHTVLKQSR